MARKYSASLNAADTARIVLHLNIVTNAVNYEKISWHVVFECDESYQHESGNRLLVKFDENIYMDSLNICAIDIQESGSKTIASGSFTHHHTGSGIQYFPIYVYFEQTEQEGYSGFISDTFICQKIGYNFTMSVDGYKLGEDITVTFSNELVKYDLFYAIGTSGTVKIGEGGYGKSVTFQLPEELAAHFPKSSGTILHLIAYSYTGEEGYKAQSHTEIRVSPSDNTLPTVDVEVSDINGYYETYGKFIQGMSRLHVKINAEGIYGSTIKLYQTVMNGAVYPGTEFDTDVIANDENFVITVTVTDSRGQTSVVEKEIEVYEYDPPRVSKLNAERCDETGELADDGEYLIVTFDGEVTSLDSQNSINYEIECIKKTDGTKKREPLNLTEYVVTDGIYIFQADVDSVYGITLYITDNFNKGQLQTNGPSISVLWSKLKNDLAIALGRFIDPTFKKIFDIGFKTRFYGGLWRLVLEDKTDLNELKIANTYAGRDIETSKYVNCPEEATGRFTLLVEDAGGNGEVYQRLTLCNKENPLVYERFFYDDEWGAWVCKQSGIVAQITELNNTVTDIKKCSGTYIGNYGSSWTIGTNWSNIGSSAGTMTYDWYKSVGGDAAYIEILQDGLYALSLDCNFTNVTQASNQTAWARIRVKRGTKEFVLKQAYCYSYTNTTLNIVLIDQLKAGDLIYGEVSSSIAGGLNSTGADMLRIHKLFTY